MLIRHTTIQASSNYYHLYLAQILISTAIICIATYYLCLSYQQVGILPIIFYQLYPTNIILLIYSTNYILFHYFRYPTAYILSYPSNIIITLPNSTNNLRTENLLHREPFGDQVIRGYQSFATVIDYRVSHPKFGGHQSVWLPNF